MHRTYSIGIVLAASAFASDLSAQSAQAISIQFSGLYNGVYGDVFSGLQNGFGAEGQIRYTPGALSFGVGFQYTNHGLQNRPEDTHLYGGFLSPGIGFIPEATLQPPTFQRGFRSSPSGFPGET